MKKINLQLFAEGASAAPGTEATGENIQDAAENGRTPEVKYGTQDDTAESSEQAQPENERKSFEDLIKGDYKKDFDDYVHNIMRKKTATIKGLQETQNNMNSVLDLVARRYGVEANDYESLTKALQNDNTYLEAEAIERGMSVEQLRNFKNLEHENEMLRRQREESLRQSESDRIYREWMDQAEGMKELYPNFDFMTEAANEDFTSLLRNGIDVKTAYEVIHKDEIIQGAMAVTAQKVKESVTNNIMANGRRAQENGTTNQSSVVYKKDVNSLTKEDMRRIEELVARGERISF